MNSAAWWLVRHAAPQVAPGTCYGALDVPADPQATQQTARRLAEALPTGTLMSHSPLQRCEQLAHYLIALRPDLASNPDPRLREMDFGDWEGRPWADIARSEIDAWTQDFAHHPPGGGESVNHVMQRVAQALDSTRNSGQDTVWVTHAGVIRATRLLLAGQRQVQHAHEWPTEAVPFGAWEVHGLSR